MRPYLLGFVSVAILFFGLVLSYYAHVGGLPVLFPSGTTGIAERDLMVHTVWLMLIVAVPVYILIVFIAWHYRAQNTKAVYMPDWEHSRLEEFIWWVIPFEIVLVLGALTWGATHQLAPEVPIASAQEPLTVEVVALPWKWLFLYPEQHVASVNELAIPAGRPVEFTITADAPMNSFWIPALGGQEYAMSGMGTKLNLLSPTPGTFEGRSANYSGEDFAGMTFPVRALSPADFTAWVAHAASSSDALTKDAFDSLAIPSAPGPIRYYGSIPFSFDDIMRVSMGMSPDMNMRDMNSMSSTSTMSTHH